MMEKPFFSVNIFMLKHIYKKKKLKHFITTEGERHFKILQIQIFKGKKNILKCHLSEFTFMSPNNSISPKTLRQTPMKTTFDL